MIKNIRFSNYRLFANSQELEIAPITIVFGKNNVGKSAMLKLPLLIKSILNSNGRDELFERTVDGIRICTEYRDVVYRKAHRVVELAVSGDNASMQVKFIVDSLVKPYTCFEEASYRAADDSEIDVEQACQMMNFDIEYLKSIRDYPANGFFDMTDKDDNAACGGVFAYRRLVDDARDANPYLSRKVSGWYERTFDGWGIEVDTSRQPIYSVMLTHGAMRNNILEGGAGIAQSLPVIVSAATQVSAPRLFIYEEPETHLHPEAHGDMAEFIAKQALEQTGLKWFLIETHSVNFLLRLRKLVATGDLKPEQLAFYYVDFDSVKESSSLQRVIIHEDGSVGNWPTDVFKETLSETLALRQAQLAREEAQR